MIENWERELDIVNEKADGLQKHYLGLAHGDKDEAFKLACRGEVVVRRLLGRIKAEAM
jgi:hypothetical protein